MSHTDLLVEGFPHGTPEGYDRGCHGHGGCPAHAEHGLSCKIAKAKSKGDYEYQKLARSGATPAAIADALGLIGTEPGAPVAKPKSKAPRNPKALDIEKAPPVVETQPEPDRELAGEELEEAHRIRATVGPLRRPDGTIDVTAVAEEATLRERAGLPSWIAVLDAPPAQPEPTTVEDSTQTPEPPRMNGPRASRSTIATGNASGNTEPAANPSAAGSATSREIRAWAITRGYDVKPRGTLPRHIIDHYWEVTGRLDAPAPKLKEPDTIAEASTSDSEDLALPTYVTDVLGPFVTDSTPADAPHPERSTVALEADLEAARALAVRLEQELARAEELRDADRLAHEASLHEALAAAHAGEVATQLALQKWAEERATSESAFGVIIRQSKRIDELLHWDRFIDAMRRLDRRDASVPRVRRPFRIFGPYGNAGTRGADSR